MVHVAQAPPSIAGSLGQALGSFTGNELAFQRDRSRLQNALGSLENLPQNATPFQLASNLLKATAGIPGSERYVGQLFPLLLQSIQAKQSQGVPFAGESQGPLQTNEQFSKQQLPSFGQGTSLKNTANATSQLSNSNTGPDQPPGNTPQSATGGDVKPVYSPQELIPQARQLAADKTKAGIPTSVQDAYKEVSAINDENKLYNQTVEKERQQRVDYQREYGQKASDALTKLMPDATEEQKSIFKKIGEDTARRKKSEADIEKSIAIEARNFKNRIANIKADLSAPRSYNSLQRKFLGTNKDFNEASKDLQIKLKPLLDLGLYDTSRNILEDIGYYPEERESIINPLNDRSNAVMNLVPQAEKTRIEAPFGGLGPQIPPLSYEDTYTYSPDQVENVKSGIKDLFDKNPNISLVLARKAFEDKNYDWRIFKNALNSLIEMGPDQGGIELNDDQFNQIKYLDSPPLNALEKILHGLNLRGR